MFEIDDDRLTHMPFVGADGKFKPHEFCCIPVDGKWKIHHWVDGEWERVPTGLPDDATECGPVAEFDEGMWKLSFIAGGCESDRRFKLNSRIIGLIARRALLALPMSVSRGRIGLYPLVVGRQLVSRVVRKQQHCHWRELSIYTGYPVIHNGRTVY
jgi:hypothetical protein